MRIRVVDLAAEVGVSVQEIADAARAVLGLHVRSATMSLRDAHADAIRAAIARRAA